MALSLKTNTTLVREQAAAVQASASGLVDLSIGSILRALVEANALIGLWLQGLFVQLMTASRASTAIGVDLDSWVGDFGLSRNGSIAALGDVTFSRFSGTGEATIALATRVETQDGVAFVVVLDTSNAAWSAARELYVMPAGQTSLTVPVEALVPGAAGNVAQGQVSLISSSVPGVDTVTNAAAFFSGSDPETDAQLRARFQLFIASLSKATKTAVAYAITSLKQNLTYSLTENVTYTGEERRGHFYVVVDDGSGSPTSETIAAVADAIEAVRPLGVDYGVFPPEVVDISVSLHVSLFTGADAVKECQRIQSAIEAYIDAQGLGGSVRWTRIAQVAYDATAATVNVSAILINGVTADVATNPRQLPRASIITVTPV